MGSEMCIRDRFLGPDGGKLPDELEEAIEAELEKVMVTVDSAELGKARRIVDAPGRYIEFCKGTFPSCLNLAGMKLVVDCANGAAYTTAPRVFAELGADVITIGDKPDGLNINQGCGATAPQALAAVVLEHQADAGVALDGDGDRIMMVDELGRIIDGDEIIYLIAKDLKARNVLQGGVVGTVMSNLGMELALKELDIPFIRAGVGDRHVMRLLKENDWQVGGEPSGHVICLHASPSGDGIIAALQVLACMAHDQQKLSVLASGVQQLPQLMINVPLKERVDIDANGAIQDAVAQTEAELGDNGRVLLRP